MEKIIFSKNSGLLSVVFYSCFLFTHFACNEAAAASMAIESSQDNTENSVVTPRFTAAFKNTDIREFINIVSKNLHKTIIIDSQVQGEVSVHSYEQLTADQYYQFFLNVLEVYGYTVITNSDNILKVVPSEKGQRAALTAQQKTQRRGHRGPRRADAKPLRRFACADPRQVQQQHGRGQRSLL
ncbi:hypothetical protein ACFQUX_03905 [Pantoea stewartii]